jgi:hypothetical protein
MMAIGGKPGADSGTDQSCGANDKNVHIAFLPSLIDMVAEPPTAILLIARPVHCGTL